MYSDVSVADLGGGVVGAAAYGPGGVNFYWQFVGDAYATWRTVSFPAGTMGG